MLEDDAGKKLPIDREAFADVLRVLRDNVRLVVLNACFTLPQALLLREVVDFKRLRGLEMLVRDGADATASFLPLRRAGGVVVT